MTATEKQKSEGITTIKLTRQTKSRLDNLKAYKRETYEETIRKILGILNMCKVNPLRARSKLSEIERQKELSNIKD
ncbi:hypothetical protein AUJ84_03350 [Candidatus Pacearchaeota archaeon CG1_02_32_132]|nr:MAG: hypothetical protein AUJ84_03350 [Candidatus Pacearchaeota archaeon CG1_02_32_132]